MKKYSRLKFRTYHSYLLLAFYGGLIMFLIYRQKWGKKVIKSKTKVY